MPTLTLRVLTNCLRRGYTIPASLTYYDPVCESFMPGLSNTEVFVVNFTSTLYGAAESTTTTFLTTSFWTNDQLPATQNLPMWHSAFPIAWEQQYASSLTVWDAAGGPSGAVVANMEFAIPGSPAFTLIVGPDLHYSTYPGYAGYGGRGHGLNGGQKAGVAIGCLLGVLFLAVGACLLWRRRHRGPRPATQGAVAAFLQRIRQLRRPRVAAQEIVGDSTLILSAFRPVASSLSTAQQAEKRPGCWSTLGAILDSRDIGLHFLVISVILILIVNICFLSIAPHLESVSDELWFELADKEQTPIIQGSCDHIQSLDTKLHVLINVLGMILLSSINGFLAILSAPHRQHLDAAHADNKAFEIGIPSFSNCWRLGLARKGFWLGLFLLSIPLNTV
jgi:hypothetical protein